MKSTLDGNIYAMKELSSLSSDGGNAMQELVDEVQKLGRIKSEFFVKYITASVHEHKLFVVMEMLHGVEFRDLIVARQALKVPFHEHQVEGWLQQLASGLAYLHDEVKLIHQASVCFVVGRFYVRVSLTMQNACTAGLAQRERDDHVAARQGRR